MYIMKWTIFRALGRVFQFTRPWQLLRVSALVLCHHQGGSMFHSILSLIYAAFHATRICESSCVRCVVKIHVVCLFKSTSHHLLTFLDACHDYWLLIKTLLNTAQVWSFLDIGSFSCNASWFVVDLRGLTPNWVSSVGACFVCVLLQCVKVCHYVRAYF